jgi:hypothetical protein
MLNSLRGLRARFFPAPTTAGVLHQFSVMRAQLSSVRDVQLSKMIDCEDTIIAAKTRRAEHIEEATKAGQASAALDRLFAL